MKTSMPALLNFHKDGFSVLKDQLPLEVIEAVIESTDALLHDSSTAGRRNLLIRSPFLKTFASSGIAFETAKEILGTTPLPVRGILFDKTPETNWYVTRHQDLSIPVKTKVDLDGYGPWSTKDGILHVQPPSSILEKMVSLRIHLDPCPDSNGPIKFIAGSHLEGILGTKQIEKWREDHDHVVCPAEVGDVIAMSPLILHSSSTSTSPAHRRVLHLEYAGTDLPSGLKRAEA